jgi:predicted nuclease of predicted toxin-antitoxin system
MLAFYMDHQFPAGVTRGLRLRKIDVLTTVDDGTERLADDLLLQRASDLGRVLVTHDTGFLDMADEWRTIGRQFAGIAFAVQQKLLIGNAIEYLELMAHAMTPEEMHNRLEYIPSPV